MARDGLSAENTGAESTVPTAAEYQLLRQQLREVVGELATLRELMRQWAQQPTTPVEVAQASLPRLAAPAMELPVVDSETMVAPPPTTVTEIPSVHPTTPSVDPTPATSGPMPGATVGDPSRETVVIPTPRVSADAAGEAPFRPTERDRVRANLANFKRYDPPVFEGETTDPWAVEKWVDTMEKLFEDLLMEEHEWVPLAVHFLEGDARRWWKTVRPDPSEGTALPSWTTFREKLFEAFLSDRIKQQMEDDLKHIKQGRRTIMGYQRAFVRMIKCVPFVIRNESHKARLFVDGLRRDIFEVVQAADLHTFQGVVDRATAAERGLAMPRARQESSDHSGDKKRTRPNLGREHTKRSRPSKHPRLRRRTKNVPTGGQRPVNKPCIICDGIHQAIECPQKQDHCFRCGKPGHFRFNCPFKTGTTPVAASTPSSQPGGGKVYTMTHQGTDPRSTM